MASYPVAYKSGRGREEKEAGPSKVLAFVAPATSPNKAFAKALERAGLILVRIGVEKWGPKLLARAIPYVGETLLLRDFINWSIAPYPDGQLNLPGWGSTCSAAGCYSAYSETTWDPNTGALPPECSASCMVRAITHSTGKVTTAAYHVFNWKGPGPNHAAGGRVVSQFYRGVAGPAYYRVQALARPWPLEVPAWLDPMGLPLLKPVGVPKPKPYWRALPDKKPTNAPQPLTKPWAQPWPQAWPDEMPSHDPRISPQTRPAEVPAPPALPIPVLAPLPEEAVGVQPGVSHPDPYPVPNPFEITVPWDGGPTSIRRGGRPSPMRGRKERPKQKKKPTVASVGGRVWTSINTLTEANDFLKALHESLPLDKQCRGCTPYGKALALYNNMGEVNIEDALANLANNQLEDAFYGLMGKGAAKSMAKGGTATSGFGRALKGAGTDKGVREQMDLMSGGRDGSSLRAELPTIHYDHAISAWVVSVPGYGDFVSAETAPQGTIKNQKYVKGGYGYLGA